MILVAIATALATRLPFVVNLVLCLVVYFLGHLAPVVVKVTETAQAPTGARGGRAGPSSSATCSTPCCRPSSSSTWARRSSARRRSTCGRSPGTSVTVFGYSLIYTVIALIVGLLLFEDRDLA